MYEIVDLHCDTLSQLVKSGQSMLKNDLHFDIERAMRSGIKIQFMALFAQPDQADICLRQILLQINRFQRALEEYSSLVYPLTSYQQIESAGTDEKMGCLLHLEGGEALGKDVEILYLLHSMGLRSLGLTWNPGNLLAGGVDAEYEGITPLGRCVIQVMEELGIILDLAHMGPRSFFEALELYRKPVMVTHANSYELCPCRRNLSNSQLKAVAENGGVIGFTQVSDFVLNGVAPGVENFLDHIAWTAELIGVEHLALGSDFDGADNIVLPGVQAYRDLPHLLEKRGFSGVEISLILAENAKRVLKQII